MANGARGKRETSARASRCRRGLPAADRRRCQEPQDAQTTNLQEGVDIDRALYRGLDARVLNFELTIISPFLFLFSF